MRRLMALSAGMNILLLVLVLWTASLYRVHRQYTSELEGEVVGVMHQIVLLEFAFEQMLDQSDELITVKQRYEIEAYRSAIKNRAQYIHYVDALKVVQEIKQERGSSYGAMQRQVQACVDR